VPLEEFQRAGDVFYQQQVFNVVSDCGQMHPVAGDHVRRAAAAGCREVNGYWLPAYTLARAAWWARGVRGLARGTNFSRARGASESERR